MSTGCSCASHRALFLFFITLFILITAVLCGDKQLITAIYQSILQVVFFFDFTNDNSYINIIITIKSCNVPKSIAFADSVLDICICNLCRIVRFHKRSYKCRNQEHHQCYQHHCCNLTTPFLHLVNFFLPVNLFLCQHSL